MFQINNNINEINNSIAEVNEIFQNDVTKKKAIRKTINLFHKWNKTHNKTNIISQGIRFSNRPEDWYRTQKRMDSILKAVSVPGFATTEPVSDMEETVTYKIIRLQMFFHLLQECNPQYDNVEAYCMSLIYTTSNSWSISSKNIEKFALFFCEIFQIRIENYEELFFIGKHILYEIKEGRQPKNVIEEINPLIKLPTILNWF